MSHENQTHQPTARRRLQARLDGNVVASSQVTAAVIAIALVAALYVWGGLGIRTAKLLFEESWSIHASLDARHLLNLLFDSVWPALGATVSLLCLVMVAAVIGRLLQVGPIWTPQRVLPELSRIAPQRRAGHLFSWGALCEKFCVGLLALAGLMLTTIGLWEQRSAIQAVAVVADWEAGLITEISTWVARLTMGLAMLAAVDYGFQRWQFEQNLRMSEDALRAEIRAIEGNPEIARARRERDRKTASSDDMDFGDTTRVSAGSKKSPS